MSETPGTGDYWLDYLVTPDIPDTYFAFGATPRRTYGVKIHAHDGKPPDVHMFEDAARVLLQISKGFEPPEVRSHAR